MLNKIKSFFNIEIIILTVGFKEDIFKDNVFNINKAKLISLTIFL